MDVVISLDKSRLEHAEQAAAATGKSLSDWLASLLDREFQSKEDTEPFAVQELRKGIRLEGAPFERDELHSRH